MEPGSGEQMSDRHAVASGEDETQHEEKILRDIHISVSASETVFLQNDPTN